MIVGLTGGIATGKSTCVRYFEGQGVPCVDADGLAKELLQKNSPLLVLLVERFGRDILLDDGALNRALLRDLIARDECARHALNAIMLPAIQDEALRRLRAFEVRYDLVIYDAPLLFENNFASYCDLVVLVDSPESLQKERAQRRDGVPLSQVEAFIQKQMSRFEKIKRANFIVDNSKDLPSLYAQCRALLDFLLSYSDLKSRGKS